MQQEILNRVDALAAKLGVAADEVYRVLVRQAQVEVVERLIMIVPLLLSWAFIWWLWGKHTNAEGREEDYWMVALVVSGIGVGILTLGVIVELSNLPTLLLNPEYWALNEILSAFGK